MSLRIEEAELARAPRLRAAVEEAERKGGARPRCTTAPPDGRPATRERPDLEGAFLTQLRRLAPYLPPPARQHRFATSASDVTRARRWAFDFAWPSERVAVEVDGGVGHGARGRHVRPEGFESDAAKRNAAQVLGWVVLVVTGRMLRRDPAGFVRLVVLVIARRRGARTAGPRVALEERTGA